MYIIKYLENPMKVYHVSNMVVERSKLIVQNRFLDFGYGIYTTANKEQAIKWTAKQKNRKETNIGYISTYEFDDKLSRTLVNSFTSKTLFFSQNNLNNIKNNAYVNDFSKIIYYVYKFLIFTINMPLKVL